MARISLLLLARRCDLDRGPGRFLRAVAVGTDGIASLCGLFYASGYYLGASLGGNPQFQWASADGGRFISPCATWGRMNDFEILGHANTSIGTLYLGRRTAPGTPGWVYEIQISGQLLMSSKYNISERQLSTTALALHAGDGPLRVLVGGLGLGYTAQAALEGARVKSVRIVEKMDFVIDWMNDGLLPLSAEFAAEGRLEVVQGDIYENLLGPATALYDLILVDVDHSPVDRLADGPGHFYTAEGQRQVARHLAPGGVLAVWSAWDNDDFADVLSNQYPHSCREDVRWDDDEEPEEVCHNVLFFAGGLERAPVLDQREPDPAVALA